MDRIVLVNGDGHASAPPEVYRDYLDPAYRYMADELVEENAIFTQAMRAMFPLTDEDRAVIDTDGAIANGPATSWDAAARVAELDREGVACEILNVGSQFAQALGHTPLCRARPAHERFAGARGHSRWLADMISDGDGRLFGVLDPGPCHDLDATVAEMRWGRDHGFVTVMAPGFVDDSSLPGIADPYYDPFYAACVDLGMPVEVHAGWGGKQGLFFDFVEMMGLSGTDGLAVITGEQQIEGLDPEQEQAVKSVFMLDLGPRLVMWQLMLGGVFDRFPDLALTLVEIRADWIPPTLRFLDERAARDDLDLRRAPSDYWARHCSAVPSSTHRAETDLRYAIGVDRMLFATDMPHAEGTWPNTVEWLRFAFAGLPEQELRQILGENAIDVFGLDRIALRSIAARIGPRVDQVLDTRPFDPKLLDHFDKRCGLRREAEAVDLGLLGEAVDAYVVSGRA